MRLVLRRGWLKIKADGHLIRVAAFKIGQLQQFFTRNHESTSRLRRSSFLKEPVFQGIAQGKGVAQLFTRTVDRLLHLLSRTVSYYRNFSDREAFQGVQDERFAVMRRGGA